MSPLQGHSGSSSGLSAKGLNLESDPLQNVSGLFCGQVEVLNQRSKHYKKRFKVALQMKGRKLAKGEMETATCSDVNASLHTEQPCIDARNYAETASSRS